MIFAITASLIGIIGSLVLVRIWRHFVAVRSMSRIPGTHHLSALTCSLRGELFLTHPRIPFSNFEKYCQPSTERVQFPGLYRHTLGETHWFLSADPDILKQILVTKFSSFGKSRFLRNLKGELNAHVNLFTSDPDDHWQMLRKLMSPAFSDSSLSVIFDTWMQTQTDVLVEKWTREVDSGSCGENTALVNVSQDMNYLTMDVITSAGFGEDVRALKGDGKGVADGRKLSHYIDTLFASVGVFFLIPTWLIGFVSVLPVSWGILGKRQLAMRGYLKYLKDMLQRRMQVGVEENNLLHRMIHAQVEEQRLTHADLLSNSHVMYAAGAETTSNTLSWCIHFISALPNVQSKLQDEVDDVMQRHNGVITSQVFEKEFPYMKAVILEALRLKSPAHNIVRRVLRPTTVKGSNGAQYKLPASSMVILHFYALHRDRQIYGDDADRFNPDRWLQMSEQQRRSVFFPFSLGKRSCIGRKFADMEMVLTLAKLIRRFRFETIVDTVEQREEKVEFTLKPKDPIQVKVFKRISGDL